MKTIKLSLAAARVNAQLTQKELADAVGVSEFTVINWETGKNLPNLKYIEALEKALGISFSQIQFEKRS